MVQNVSAERETSPPYWAEGFAASGWSGKDRCEGGSLLQPASVRKSISNHSQWGYTGTVHEAAVTPLLPIHYLCDSRQLCTEVWQNGVLLRLDVSMKFGLDGPCWRVEQNSRKLNCTEGTSVQGHTSSCETTRDDVRHTWKKTKQKKKRSYLFPGCRRFSPSSRWIQNQSQSDMKISDLRRGTRKYKYVA